MLCRVRACPAKATPVAGKHTRIGRVMYFSRASLPDNVNDPEPARAMALPNGLWLLDFLQDKFYDVRGESFVIQRAEGRVQGAASKPRKSKGTLQPLRRDEQLGMIHKVMWRHPESIMLLEGGTVEVEAECADITDFLDLVPDITAAPPAFSPTSCTGIVPVPQEADVDVVGEEEEELFVTNSTSPRRTKMVGFTCKCCGARNMSAVNPNAFISGTLVAQCAKCERWHKLTDHLNLFHCMQGPLFPGAQGGAVTMDDVPPSLRVLDPFYWQQQDGLDGGASNN